MPIFGLDNVVFTRIKRSKQLFRRGLSYHVTIVAWSRRAAEFLSPDPILEVSHLLLVQPASYTCDDHKVHGIRERPLSHLGWTTSRYSGRAERRVQRTCASNCVKRIAKTSRLAFSMMSQKRVLDLVLGYSSRLRLHS